MIDKLIAAFNQPQSPPERAEFDPSFGANRAMQALTGMPVEKAVEHIRLRYVHDTQVAIRELKATVWPWIPQDWVVVASPYIFPGWTHIEGVRVLHTCPFDWGVFATRSPEFLERVMIESIPRAFKLDVREN